MSAQAPAGWAPASDAALSTLAKRHDSGLVAAPIVTLKALSVRLKAIAVAAGCEWERLTPSTDDWNDALQMQAKNV